MTLSSRLDHTRTVGYFDKTNVQLVKPYLRYVHIYNYFILDTTRHLLDHVDPYHRDAQECTEP